MSPRRASATKTCFKKTRTMPWRCWRWADLTSRSRGPEAEVLDWIQRAKVASPDSTTPFRAEIDHYRRNGQLDKALAVALAQSKLTRATRMR